MLRRTMSITTAVCATVALASCMMAQQPIAPPTPQEILQHADPNLLGQHSPSGLKVGWLFTGSILTPSIALRLDSARAPMDVMDYLGWNGEGSWLIAKDRHVYVWNLPGNSLTRKYETAAEIPTATLDSLRSPAELYLYPTPDKRMDPNLPTPQSPDPDGLRIGWVYRGTEGGPVLYFTSIAGRLNREAGYYLGWNDKGSWINNATDGHVYIWNLRQNRLTVAYEERNRIPASVLASLHQLEGVPTPLAAYVHTQPVSEPTPQPQAVRDAIIEGTGADVRGGVLLFIRPDKTRASYKVVRPKMTQAALPPAGDITGAWIAMEEGGDGIMFTVGPDKSVSGREIPAQALKMLMQPPH